MMRWIKAFLCGLTDELLLKSTYGREMGTDTFLRWLGTVAFCLGFYLCIHYFPYEQPVPEKIQWHRMAAAGMAGTGILAASGEFGVSLYRRIRARLASKTLNSGGDERVP